MRKSTCLIPQKSVFDPAKMREFLLALYPQDTTKAVAAVLTEALRPVNKVISPRTVENWLSDHSAPGFLTVGAMISLWGPDFLCAVMTSPPEWASEAKARAELEALERRSAAIRNKLNKAP